MGLGPSIKMTTLHHYNCPVTKMLSSDEDIEFPGIIVTGVSEVYEDKIRSAVRTGFMAEGLRADGALVAIDGWGNHHVDFVNVIEQLGLKGIPSVGLSYIGTQGRLVCSNAFVDTIIDFNKCGSGYESCVVGQNNLSETDAFKAAALLKSKIKKTRRPWTVESESSVSPRPLRRLTRRTLSVHEVRFGEQTFLKNGILTIRRGIEEGIAFSQPRIKKISVRIVSPGKLNFFVNSNLDYSPVACKVNGRLGEGITCQIGGITVMLTGVEDKSEFQPSIIGSSEGILKDRVILDQAGTPSSSDFLLHIDFLFEEGEARTAEGIQAAHESADRIIDEIRNAMRSAENMEYTSKDFYDIARPGKKKVILVKIVSGLGNMYDTSLFPREPGGYIGSRQMRDIQNMPVFITPNQCRDGAIHSLL